MEEALTHTCQTIKPVMVVIRTSTWDRYRIHSAQEINMELDTSKRLVFLVTDNLDLDIHRLMVKATWAVGIKVQCTVNQ